ncbi:MAG: YicC/YloC family endoribonuclease [Planctomycetota bacterium]
MLRSMTGYGESTAEGGSFLLTVEVKSVNNKFLKIATKIGDEISYIQNELEEQARRHIVRGSVAITVRFLPTSNVDFYEIDRGVLEKYLATLNRLQSELGLEGGVCLKDLLLLPGVVRVQEAQRLGKETVLPLAMRAMEEALARLVAMREAEGSRLEAEFRERAQTLRALVSQMRLEAPLALEDYRVRLEERINLFLEQKGVALSAEDVLREVALLAERSDVNEEVSRLEGHIVQLEAALEADQPAGRKLEFILQEMAREANTMGSKTSGSRLSRLVLEAKAEVDKLREQAANVE